jgi:putative transposase
MPDHVHLFCAPLDHPPEGLSPWITWWKRTATRRCQHGLHESLWQANYWDRQLRSMENYQEKWDYVRNNPVRAGLVQRTEDWLYAGIIDRLDW